MKSRREFFPEEVDLMAGFASRVTLEFIRRGKVKSRKTKLGRRVILWQDAKDLVFEARVAKLPLPVPPPELPSPLYVGRTRDEKRRIGKRQAVTTEVATRYLGSKQALEQFEFDYFGDQISIAPGKKLWLADSLKKWKVKQSVAKRKKKKARR
jgi:hypothetical protein